MGWLFLAVAVVVLLAVWVTWTANRIDRLEERVRSARAALDAQLVRRAAAAQALADEHEGLSPALRTSLRGAAQEALGADDTRREAAENDLGRLFGQVDAAVVPGDLREAASRVGLARRFYNDAVRDLRDLRGQRLPRLFRLGARRPVPSFFEIDDRLPPDPEVR